MYTGIGTHFALDLWFHFGKEGPIYAGISTTTNNGKLDLLELGGENNISDYSPSPIVDTCSLPQVYKGHNVGAFTNPDILAKHVDIIKFCSSCTFGCIYCWPLEERFAFVCRINVV